MKLGRPMRVGREWRFISGGNLPNTYEKDFSKGGLNICFFLKGNRERKNVFLFIDTKPLIFLIGSAPTPVENEISNLAPPNIRFSLHIDVKIKILDGSTVYKKNCLNKENFVLTKNIDPLILALIR